MSRDGREERAEDVNKAVDCYCLGMDEKNERKVWAMLLTVIRLSPLWGSLFRYYNFYIIDMGYGCT
jgi:hypothetical protein